MPSEFRTVAMFVIADLQELRACGFMYVYDLYTYQISNDYL